MAPIPQRLSDLTDEWLSAALGRDVHIRSCEQIGAGVGILCVLARLTLDDGSTVIAKIGSEFPETLAIVQGYGFYKTETGFYRDVAHRDLGLRLAACLYADVSDDGIALALLLEDLGGGRALDQIVGCPVDVAEKIVDAMAGFHAHWWDNPELESMTWLRPINNDAYKSSQGHFAGVWPMFVERFAGRWSDDAFSIGAKVGTHLAAIYDHVWAERPRTIAHTDFRLDNLLFDLPDGSPFAVLDWQLTVAGLGIGDITYFLTQSMSVEDRRANEDRLVRRWHDGLVRGGVSNYSFDDAWRDYRLSTLLYLSIPVIGCFMPQANERGVQLLDVMVDRAMTAIEDHRPVEFVAD